ncbi:hypothetical protein ANN_16893 [Periplaneta americana]|uniref:Uncharacterized protein n=1 Tax=Periplaneta americana TaxID=6978 RepID=A0ABQ8SSM1_PERAM|nr:hypothetical protein ANN_16893 [Periplaneta americana]
MDWTWVSNSLTTSFTRLNTIGFLFLGYMKTLVYETPVKTQDLVARIQIAAGVRHDVKRMRREAYEEKGIRDVRRGEKKRETRLRVFENKVLKKIFGAKRDEVTGEWRKLDNTEVHALYSSPDIIRNIRSRQVRWAGHVARMGESRNAYRVSVGRPEGIRPLGRPRRRWEDNIKMDLREVGYDTRDWINLAQDRDQWRAYVRTAMNLGIMQSSANSLIFDVP